MSEQVGHEQYIKCSGCKCKYINDDEHIKNDFGYNRLNVQYKCCVKCRNKKKLYYKANAIAVSDAQRIYYVQCSICNVSIYNYQMTKHQVSLICSVYAEMA